jgi:hypothetical protein
MTHVSAGGLRSPGNLNRHPQSAVVVFAVWEPILPTDWSKPSTSALARLNDRRVRQYWDRDHTLSAVLKNAEETGARHPDCCERNGFLWDLTAAYAPGVQWRATLPQPMLLNGPVVQTTADLDNAVAKAK